MSNFDKYLHLLLDYFSVRFSERYLHNVHDIISDNFSSSIRGQVVMCYFLVPLSNIVSLFSHVYF